ncbi:MAG: hypothetical protein ABIO76_07295 [Ginsengibacter sp.]
MRNRKRNVKALAISIFVLGISFFNFTRLSDSDCIRAIHIITLLVCGMAIGVFLANLFALIRKK